MPAEAESSLSIRLADEAAMPPAPRATITTTVRAVNILLTQLYSCPEAARFPYPREQGLRSKGVRGFETGTGAEPELTGIVLMVNAALSRATRRCADTTAAE